MKSGDSVQVWVTIRKTKLAATYTESPCLGAHPLLRCVHIHTPPSGPRLRQPNHERILSMTTNQTDNRTAAQATSRPDLYAGTCWGNSNLALNPDITPAIIQNRKRLVDDWRLTAHADTPSPHRFFVDVRHEYDYPELYRDNDGGLVLVVSNWGTKPPPSALGMQEIAPVLSHWAKSYARRFPNANIMRKALQRAMRERWG